MAAATSEAAAAAALAASAVSFTGASAGSPGLDGDTFLSVSFSSVKMLRTHALNFGRRYTCRERKREADCQNTPFLCLPHMKACSRESSFKHTLVSTPAPAPAATMAPSPSIFCPQLNGVGCFVANACPTP